MYAVIQNGGKQYRVSVGDVIRIEKREEAEGSAVELRDVLLLADGDQVEVGAPHLPVVISATIRAHGRADKINIFKTRRRKHFRKHAGHRQHFTEIEITGIAKRGA